jgi:mono/diheme cytochrome c family protein
MALLLGAVALPLGLAAACAGPEPAPTGAPAPVATAANGQVHGGAAAADGASTDPQLALGREVYDLECASCHGARGEGEPDWMITRDDGSLPAPPHDASGHTWHHPDDELLAIIADGGTVYMPNSNMPGYRDRLSGSEMVAVLAYIKSMWGPTERTYQAERTLEWQLMMGAEAPTSVP